MKPVPSVCANCEHWSRFEKEPGDKPGEVQAGECKRFPPILVHTDEGTLFMAPITEYHDHCGEFKIRMDA